MPESTQNARVMQFGVFEVDLQAGELRKSGLRIKLQDQPFQILVLLLEHPGEVVTREQLRQRLWPADTFVDFDHSLNGAVKKLRLALGDDPDNPRFIELTPAEGTASSRRYKVLFLPRSKFQRRSACYACNWGQTQILLAGNSRCGDCHGCSSVPVEHSNSSSKSAKSGARHPVDQGRANKRRTDGYRWFANLFQRDVGGTARGHHAGVHQGWRERPPIVAAQEPSVS